MEHSCTSRIRHIKLSLLACLLPPLCGLTSCCVSGTPGNVYHVCER